MYIADMTNAMLLNRVEMVTESGCWIWLGCIESYGYGRVSARHNGKAEHRYAHRVFYLRFKGEIKPPLLIDHLCRVRCCVNPDHLELVTNRDNILRGIGLTAINARKTHCMRGHVLDGDNLYITPRKGRVCKICQRNWVNKRRKALRSKK